MDEQGEPATLRPTALLSRNQIDKREYAWMTVHEYRADKQVSYPFKEFATLTSE